VASTIIVGVGYLLSLFMISVESCTVIVAITGSVYGWVPGTVPGAEAG
jgi:hypothetical protein